MFSLHLLSQVRYLCEFFFLSQLFCRHVFKTFNKHNVLKGSILYLWQNSSNQCWLKRLVNIFAHRERFWWFSIDKSKVSGRTRAMHLYMVLYGILYSWILCNWHTSQKSSTVVKTKRNVCGFLKMSVHYKNNHVTNLSKS